MKAMILASGAGTRLRPLTDKVPKCMVEVCGKTILQRQLEILESNGIKKVVITTGPFEEMVKKHVRKNFPTTDIEYVNNPDFMDTNYIYSMWLARGKIDDDMLLLHGDLVFDGFLLKKMLISRIINGVLVNKITALPEKDFKAVIENGMVSKIGVNFFGENAFFCAPFYKLSRKAASIWLEKITEYVRSAKTRCYAEDALNDISKEMELIPIFYEKEFCMEIDDNEDLKKACGHFKKV